MKQLIAIIIALGIFTCMFSENTRRIKEITKIEKYYSRYDTLNTKFYYDTTTNELLAKKTYKNGIKFDSVSYVYKTDKIVELFYIFDNGRSVFQRSLLYKTNVDNKIVAKKSKLFEEEYIYENGEFVGIIENNKDDSPIYRYMFTKSGDLLTEINLSTKNGKNWDSNNYQRYICKSEAGKLSKLTFQNKVNRNWNDVKVIDLKHDGDKTDIKYSVYGKLKYSTSHKIDSVGDVVEEKWFNKKGDLTDHYMISYEEKPGNYMDFLEINSARNTKTFNIPFIHK